MSKNEMEKKLAVSLIKNHLQHLGLDQTAFKEIVAEEVIDDFNFSRVIAIIGAGASSSLGLPLGIDAKERIIDSISMPETMLKAELERLTTVFRLPGDTFETTLMALCSNEHTAIETRKKLQDLYNFRYIPSLCYEILAHLFKHRFIDAIVNFNFDELLDQAIEDELDKEEYVFVLSDGDCPNEFQSVNPVLERPLYIKPHGTVSHPSTLRFTHEDYFRLPYGIKTLIEKLIAIHDPLVLMGIGFGMQSFEFNKILEKAPPKSVIYNLNVREVPLVNELNQHLKSRLINVKKIGLNKTMDNLWENIYALFKEGYKPRKITRHKFVSTLFESNKGVDTAKYKKQLPRYFRQRAIIEVCLESAKCKGIINIGELSKERSGRYYDKYVNGIKENEKETYYEVCKSLGFYDLGYSKELLRLKELGQNEDESILTKSEFRATLGSLFDKVKRHVPALEHRLKKYKHFEQFSDPLLDHYDNEGAEIKSIKEPLHAKIFRKPKNIQTRTEFNYLTYEILNNKSCEYVWIVTETGAWLTNAIINRCLKEKKRKVSLSLILGDLSWRVTLKDRYSNLIKEIYKMEWWAHNRHMTITLDSNKNPISSIYFNRRQKTSRITPVLLDKVDTKIIIQAYNAYKKKAEKIEL